MKRRDMGLLLILILSVAAVFKFFPPGGKSGGPSETGLAVHFIDVGQGDCELIQYAGTGILIDAGEAANGPKVAKYLRDAGITALERVIATHPHSDHIGGLAEIIAGFDVGSVVMSDVSWDTASFENLLNAVRDKGLTIEIPKPGAELETSIEGLRLEVLAPNGSGYSDLNEYSIVVKASYGATSFLFTGDASSVSETEMLERGYGLSADVLKAGHHGSSTSTGQAFLSAVNPSLAVISCGKDNSYGHPAPEVLRRLNSGGVRVYRTDLSGTIKMVTDGAKISVTTGK